MEQRNNNGTELTETGVFRLDRSSRLVEVSVSVMASALVSAITVSWTLSATLAEIRAENRAFTQRIERVEIDVKQQDAVNGQQNIVQAGANQQLLQISAAIADMSRKVDEIYRNQNRAAQ